MMIRNLIASDRQARDAASTLEALDSALSSEQALAAVVQGLPTEVIEGVRKSLNTERRELRDLLDAYEQTRSGNHDAFRSKAGNDLGAALVVARVARGLSQKDLARKLGQHEQAIQRYEAEKYRSISLANFLKVASVLGVEWQISHALKSRDGWNLASELAPADARKLLKHARENGWLDKVAVSDDDGLSQIKRHLADHIVRYGTPSLLRTGLNVVDLSDDWSLLCWKAQVTRRAEAIVASGVPDYRPLDVSWLLDLVRLSAEDDGPAKAAELLFEHGIVLIVEPGIPGMRVDGAAFLAGDIPVVALTLLRDRIDNFWFTLLHEVAHVILHYRTGLATGFFDDVEHSAIDEIEDEANAFAQNLLIPSELWRRSPARIAKSAQPIEAFARQLGIHSAIVFGRIRLERNDYSLFANKIGQGGVKRHFTSGQKKVSS